MKFTLLFLVFILAVSIRLYKLGSYDFYFDEGATWNIARNDSILQIIGGQYSDEGGLPIPYLILKPLVSVVINEFALRAFSVFCGILSCLFFYKIFRFTAGWLFALFCTLALAVNPAVVHYTREFRFYSLGLLIQTIWLYVFLRLIRGSRDWRWQGLFFAISLLALFTVFSSVYLLFFCVICVIWIRVRATNHSFYKRLLLLSFLSLIIFFAWFTTYVKQPDSWIALQNYESLKNRNIAGSIVWTLLSIFSLAVYWQGPTQAYNPLHIIVPIQGVMQWVMLGLAGVGMIFSFHKTIHGSDLWKPADRQAHVFMLLLFLSITLPSVAFSLLYFNVVSIKILLLLVIPGTYFLINGIYFFCWWHKFGKELIVFVLLIIISYLTCLSIKNVLNSRYSFSSVYNFMISKRKEQQCSVILVSHEVAASLLRFYDLKYQKHIFENSYLIPVNAKDPDGLAKVIRMINVNIVNKDTPCDSLFLVRYYDTSLGSPENTELKVLLSYYKKEQELMIDPCCLSATLYTKK